jgi:hypothetical protein
MSHEPEAATKSEIIAIYEKIIADLKARALKDAARIAELEEERDAWKNKAEKREHKKKILDVTTQ